MGQENRSWNAPRARGPLVDIRPVPEPRRAASPPSLDGSAISEERLLGAAAKPGISKELRELRSKVVDYRAKNRSLNNQCKHLQSELKAISSIPAASEEASHLRGLKDRLSDLEEQRRRDKLQNDNLKRRIELLQRGGGPSPQRSLSPDAGVALDALAGDRIHEDANDVLLGHASVGIQAALEADAGEAQGGSLRSVGSLAVATTVAAPCTGEATSAVAATPKEDGKEPMAVANVATPILKATEGLGLATPREIRPSSSVMFEVGTPQNGGPSPSKALQQLADAHTTPLRRVSLARHVHEYMHALKNDMDEMRREHDRLTARGGVLSARGASGGANDSLSWSRRGTPRLDGGAARGALLGSTAMSSMARGHTPRLDESVCSTARDSVHLDDMMDRVQRRVDDLLGVANMHSLSPRDKQKLGEIVSPVLGDVASPQGSDGSGGSSCSAGHKSASEICAEKVLIGELSRATAIRDQQILGHDEQLEAVEQRLRHMEEAFAEALRRSELKAKQEADPPCTDGPVVANDRGRGRQPLQQLSHSPVLCQVPHGPPCWGTPVASSGGTSPVACGGPAGFRLFVEPALARARSLPALRRRESVGDSSATASPVVVAGFVSPPRFPVQVAVSGGKAMEGRRGGGALSVIAEAMIAEAAAERAAPAAQCRWRSSSPQASTVTSPTRTTSAPPSAWLGPPTHAAPFVGAALPWRRVAGSRRRVGGLRRRILRPQQEHDQLRRWCFWHQSRPRRHNASSANCKSGGSAGFVAAAWVGMAGARCAGQGRGLAIAELEPATGGAKGALALGERNTVMAGLPPGVM